MTKCVVCAAFAVFFAVCAVAMPSRSDLKKVQPTVNELMAEDISAMKSGKQTAEGAAAKAEELAGLATDEASKFLLLKGAFGLYVEGGKYEAAIATLETLKAQVKDVPDKVLADIVRAKMKKVSKKDGGAILSYYAQLDRRMRYADEKAKLEKAVKDSPSDKDAHRQLALATAVLDGWSAALAEFALAGGDLAAAAKAEQGGNVAAAADGWWTCAAASGDEDAQEELKAHAAALYAQAIKDGKLDGLKRALAEKRIAECGGCVPGGLAPSRPAEETRARTPSAPQESASSTPAAESWEGPNVPIDTRKLAPIKIPLKGANPLEFVPIPAGKFRTGGGLGAKGLCQGVDVVITRPFLMAKTPLTFAQWKALLGAEHPFEGNLRTGHCRPEEAEVYQKLGKSALMARCTLSNSEFALEELNRKHRKVLPKGYVFRLPTLAEAEHVENGGRTERGLGSHRKESEWAEAENVTFGGYATLLTKAGLVLPKAQFGERRDNRLGKYRNAWEGCLCPVGTRSPNPYGICDLFQESLTLDRLGPEVLPPGCSDGKMHPMEIMDGCDRLKAGQVDPFFWTSSSVFTFVRRGHLWQNYPLPASWGGGALRIVIGPDLVKERKSKKQ